MKSTIFNQRNVWLPALIFIFVFFYACSTTAQALPSETQTEQTDAELAQIQADEFG